MKRSRLILGALFASLFFVAAGSVSAANIQITTLRGNWNNGVASANGPQGNPIQITNSITISTVSWGGNASHGYVPRSSYVYVSNIPPTQNLNPVDKFETELFSLGQFIHHNINGVNPKLTSVNLDIVLDMTVDGNVIPTKTFTFSFQHDETDNSFPCPYGATDGVPCDDRVTFGPVPLPTTFNVDGVDYTLSMYFVDNNGNPASIYNTKEGTKNTAQLVAKFAIPANTVIPPTFNPPAGNYSGTISVSMHSATAGSEVRFTTDGSNPTASSTLYAAAIPLSANTTIRAFAFKSGMNNSATVAAAYTFSDSQLPTAATPTFTPNGGSFDGSVQVSMQTTTSGAEIRYTTNGSNPTAASTLYSGPITLSATTNLKALAIKSGMNNSGIASATFTANPPAPGTVATPSINPNGGTFSGSVSVTMQTATSGAELRYTTNGSNPTSSSTLYSGPVTLSANTTVKVIALKSGMTDSAIATAVFVVNPILPTVATPTFNPNGGSFNTTLNVSINSATSGSTIKYTTDGSDPRTSGTAVTGNSVTLSGSATLKAYAFKSGSNDSAVATSLPYTYQAPPFLHHVTVNPKNATVNAGQAFNFTAVAYDQYGSVMPNVTFNWSSTGGAASAGAFTAPMEAQQVTVTATASGKSDSAMVRVVAFSAGESLDEVKLGPVPFKSTSGDPGITFRNLPPDSKIRIFTANGRTVQTINVPNGGDQLWDVRNANLDAVASGVYFYIIEHGGEKRQGKVVVIH